MKNQAIYFSAVILAFFSSVLFAQIESSEFKMPELKIIESKSRDFAEKKFSKEINYVILTDDSIKINPLKEHYSVSINDISSVTIKCGSSYGGWAIAGSVTGFIFGYVLGSSAVFFNYHGNNIAGGIAGGLLLCLPVAALFGGVGSMLENRDVEYKLENYSKEDRKAFLMKLLRDKEK